MLCVKYILVEHKRVTIAITVQYCFIRTTACAMHRLGTLFIRNSFHVRDAFKSSATDAPFARSVIAVSRIESAFIYTLCPREQRARM